MLDVYAKHCWASQQWHPGSGIMRLVVLIPIVYLAAVFQTSLVEAIRIGRVEPDLLAMTALVWLLVAAGPRGFLAAGLIGLVADLLSPGRLGLGLACYLVVGYALVRLRTRVGLESVSAQLAAVWGGATLLALGQAVGRWLLGEPGQTLPASLAGAIGVGVYTAALSLPVLMVVSWIRQPRLARRRRFRDL
jgi:rod shape-determining protein MreD